MLATYENCFFKNWVKLQPENKVFKLENYNNKNYFLPVANVVLDDELKNGIKKRNTFIKFDSLIPNKEFDDKETEWLYLFTINDNIVKIGGTRNGLRARCGSYLCGHHIRERGKSGDCSKTNGYVYNTFVFYLENGYNIKMYGYKLPRVSNKVEILGNEVEIVSQTYHIYESKFLLEFKKKYSTFPYLSDNCKQD